MALETGKSPEKVAIGVVLKTKEQREFLYEVFRDQHGVNTITIFHDKKTADGNQVAFYAEAKFAQGIRDLIERKGILVTKFDHS